MFKFKNGFETMIYIALIALIFGLIAILFKSWIFVVPMALCGWIAIQGYVVIPNNPPHIGVITRFGTRTNEYLNEGMGFLFLQGIVNDLILINMIKKNIDFDEQILITPDNATTKVKTSLSFIPDQDNIINYLNNGKEEGIRHFITDIEQEKLRIWARAKTEGPPTWEALNNSAEEAVKLIVSAVCGEDLSLSAVTNIRKGNGKWKIPHLGIILIRYNITEMETFGKVYEASTELKKEEKQRKSETYEVKTDLDKAKAIVKYYQTQGTIITIAEAMKEVMDWKIKREANAQFSLSSIAQIFSNSLKGGK